MYRKIAVPIIFLSAQFSCLAPARAQNPSASQAAAAHLDTGTLDRYAGQYGSADEPDIIYSIFREGDHLTIESARLQRIILTPESPTSFVSKEPEGRIQFTIDPAGKVTGAKTKNGSYEMTLERISDQPVHNHFRPY
ncbi:MAG: hypothetical protein JOZ33_00785, partial [Acidobacteriaceae bacterium]|nr:hypothetical protein [Acidobacteriaceae bacterium]